MYRYIEAELSLSGLTKKELAERIGMKYNTFLSRMRGEYSFSLDEALIIKKHLGTEKPIEKFFIKSDEQFQIPH